MSPVDSLKTRRGEARLTLDVLQAFRQTHPSISAVEIVILLQAHLQPDASMTQVAEVLGVPMQSASTAVYTLESGRNAKSPGLGLVEISLDKTDRRVRNVRLSPKGKRAVLQALAGFDTRAEVTP